MAPYVVMMQRSPTGDMRMTAMRIGELARRAGVNVQTVRYYERRGLLHDPRRRGDGYRE